MPVRDARFLRDRRLSAGSADARHPSDAGELSQGAQDHSGSGVAKDRSGAGREWSAAALVEAQVAGIGQRSPVRRLGSGLFLSGLFLADLFLPDLFLPDLFLPDLALLTANLPVRNPENAGGDGQRAPNLLTHLYLPVPYPGP